MRYYGAKTKLLPFIETAVKQTGVNGNSTFVDLFAGTCAVGKHFKKLGYTVISNDQLEFSYALSKTFIELNKEPNFNKLRRELSIKGGLQSIFDYINKLSKLNAGFIFKNYSPNGGKKYFSDDNALRIDTYRELFENWKKAELINELEFYYLITSLLRAVNLVSNVSGTYAAFLKTWDKRALKKIILEPVEIIESENKNKAFKEDANNLITRLKPDILYLDPPYNSRQYASNYFILELIAEGWFEQNPKIYGVTGMREYVDKKSKYCSKTSALVTLEDLIEKSSKAKFILLSYNNEGIISLPQMVRSLDKYGKVEIFQENHKRYRSINQTINDPQLTFENLFVIQPKNRKNKVNNLSGKEWLQNSFSIWRELGKSEEEKNLKHPAIFTIKLVSKIIDTFCKPDNGVILDCFAGSGTTLIAGLLKGKDVIGIDLNLDYKKLFIKRMTHHYDFNEYGLEKKYLIYDSRNLSNKIEENSIDLCVTSPPYWDILNRARTADYKQSQNYSDDINDLGNIDEYDEFLHSLKFVFEQVYKVLKPKCYFILNVMDLRKKNKFYPLHMDSSKIAREVGFSLEDIIIWDRQNDYNNMRPLGFPYKFIVNKVHEYLLIFRKGEENDNSRI